MQRRWPSHKEISSRLWELDADVHTRDAKSWQPHSQLQSHATAARLSQLLAVHRRRTDISLDQQHNDLCTCIHNWILTRLLVLNPPTNMQCLNNGKAMKLRRGTEQFASETAAAHERPLRATGMMWKGGWISTTSKQSSVQSSLTTPATVKRVQSLPAVTDSVTPVYHTATANSLTWSTGNVYC